VTSAVRTLLHPPTKCTSYRSRMALALAEEKFASCGRRFFGSNPFIMRLCRFPLLKKLIAPRNSPKMRREIPPRILTMIGKIDKYIPLCVMQIICASTREYRCMCVVRRSRAHFMSRATPRMFNRRGEILHLFKQAKKIVNRFLRFLIEKFVED